jgi:non-specific serine/threonine protein kinase
MAVITPPTSPPVPHFGRFELRQLLSRSLEATTWRAFDPRLQQEVILCVPRAQPRPPHDLENWHQDVQAASRLKHPRLVDVLEISIQDGWPFISAQRGTSVSLVERLAAGPEPTVAEVVGWMVDVLDGLAYAHEAGVPHRDLGLHNVLIDTNGRASVVGLGVGFVAEVPGKTKIPRTGVQQQRAATEHDVLMAGLLMYRLLAGSPALDDPDLCSAAERVGREIVRLPWSASKPVPDTLRAIVNRSTDRQQRQRYLNARTLLAALQGWIKTNEQESGGPLALLIDRLNTVGSLPSRPRMGRVFAQSLGKDNLRVDDVVDIIAKDPALVWELLRHVNTARFQTGISDDRVTTITRSVVLMGQVGLRSVSGILRPWPGVLAAAESKDPKAPPPASQVSLEKALRRTCIAGHIARLLAPFSISDEEALVAAISQRLGHLLVRYHFPDEAAQIDRLMQPGPPPDPASPPTPGMGLEAAAGAVLGVDMEELSIAVMRHWGMEERLQQAARALNKSSPVRRPDDGAEMLRAVASLANELTIAVGAEPTRLQALVNHCFTRYGRALGLTFKECQEALETAVRLVDAPVVPPAAKAG